MPTFRAFDFVSRLPIRQSPGANCRKSPATSANIPVLQRLSAETKCDHDCRPRAAVDFAHSQVVYGGSSASRRSAPISFCRTGASASRNEAGEPMMSRGSEMAPM
jgi:hypothetical protein